MIKGLIINSDIYGTVYGSQDLREISELINLCGPVQNPGAVLRNPSVLAGCEVIMTGWGAPEFNSELLSFAPELKAIFYAGGGIKGLFDEKACRERKLIICTAVEANGIPTAEYAVSQILACLKGIWQYSNFVRQNKYFPERESISVPGIYGCKVGLISLGVVGRIVAQMLGCFPDINVIAYDPYVDEQAKELRVEMCSLESVFNRSDVVSLHAPWLKETENLIGADNFRSMKRNASFINSARGAVVRENEMIEVLKERQDITAVLDVTHPEPPVAGSPLYTLPNVVLTPHIAGSICGECVRLGRYMVDELRRYIAGQPLKWRVNLEQYRILA
jgi:phosphoglycerate dehydrogenase-like enzyme